MQVNIPYMDVMGQVKESQHSHISAFFSLFTPTLMETCWVFQRRTAEDESAKHGKDEKPCYAASISLEGHSPIFIGWFTTSFTIF